MFPQTVHRAIGGGIAVAPVHAGFIMSRVLHQCVGALALIILTTTCGDSERHPGHLGTVAAPDMTLHYLDGRDGELSSLKGRVVLLNFWATWCPPCRTELPHFQDLYQTYKDDGLVVVGVSMDKGGSEFVKRFVDEVGLTYPIAMGPAAEMERIWSRIESVPTVTGFGHEPPGVANGSVAMMPTTFIIDRAGMIYEKHVGPRTRAQLEPKLRMLMGKEEHLTAR